MRYKLFALFALLAVVGGGAPIYVDDFTDRGSGWSCAVHKDLVNVEFGAKGRNFTGLIVVGDHKIKVDTAWCIRSKRIVLPKKRKPCFVISFDIAPDVNLDFTGEQGIQWQNAIFWYNDDGKVLSRHPILFSVRAGDFQTVRAFGVVPEDAAALEIQLGFDGPNLWGGKSVAYKNLMLDWADSIELAKKPAARCDFWPPRVKMTSSSPTTDKMMRPSFTVKDDTGVDWSRFRIALDGKEATDAFERIGDEFVWKGTEQWTDGIHRIDVTVADTLGNQYVSKKCFFIGEPPRGPRITLRDDGMTMIDGKPFFPIGLYGVMRREFNGHDFVKAFDGLKAGGFNAAHSYGEARDPSFLSEAEKHGFMLWMETRLPDSRFVERERHYPHVLAWYLGDDTSGHEKPWELLDYDEATKAVDPNRITCQADGVRSAAEISAYRDYVEGTDVFLPEIYPLVLDTPEENRECVARVIRDMKRIASDIKESGVEKPRGIWPIIQYFKGWGWKHFPTRDELFAMTFASICHGAHGMTWYAYCGMVRPECKQYNYGVTSTSERWRNICDLAARLRTLAPVLTERTFLRIPEPEIISGPKTDPLGYGSISTLLKCHNGEYYIIAVNSSDQKVVADMDISSVCPDSKSAEMLFERHDYKFADGKLSCEFAPFAVRIWKIFASRPSPRLAQLSRIESEFELYGIVHWGLNTYIDREWGFGDEDPILLAPSGFDADQIVRTAKDGALQGLIVVAKHHDGFCLWPTLTTEYNISKSPFRGGRGDYVREMSDACKRYGLKFGVYCSPWDRNSAAYSTPAYVDIFHAQIKELLDGRYGEVFEMWFDNANGGDGYYGGARQKRSIPNGYYRFDEIFDFVRRLQPGVCIFNEDDAADFRWPGNERGVLDDDCRATGARFDITRYGDYRVWAHTGVKNGVKFHPPEADFPLRRGWFYHVKEKGSTKSPLYLMQRYLFTVGNGGSMNIGLAPDKRGLMCNDDVRALKEFGMLKKAFFANEIDRGACNVVVMREDVSNGEHVDSWSLEADGERLLCGKSIGIKRIRILPRIVDAEKIRLVVKSDMHLVPKMKKLRFYRVDEKLLQLVMSATEKSGETDTAEWMTSVR